jgi:predicted DNA-binding transcriptional regulator YafY/transcriptional regulator with XRE-family HTH domain
VTARSHRSGADGNLDCAGEDSDAAAQRRELVTQLARRRAAAGLSQADVAKLMRTSQPAVARLESGRYDMQLPTLARYAEALGLSLLEPPQPGAGPQGRGGRKPKDNVPAAAPAAPDAPGPAEIAAALSRKQDHVLSSRQREVLRVIRESIETRGHPPSLREIGDAVGLASTSSVSHHLRTLQRAGYLHRDSRRPRTVEVRDYTAVLRARSGTGFGLRRNAYWVRADDQPDGQGWDLVATRFADMAELAEYAASFGPHVVVLAPADLREAVIAKLEMARLKIWPAIPANPAAPAPGGAQAKWHVVMPDADRVEEVARAIGGVLAAGRRVHLRYYSEKKEEVTERDVDPIGLFVESGRPAPYLHGWCRLREERRFFRLDRVLALEVLDTPASPPADAELLSVDQGLFRPSHDDMRVELELSGPGRWVAEYYPCESVSDLEDGRLRVVLRTPDTGWVWRLALRLGEDGRVVSPDALAAEIRRTASEALEHYTRLPAPPLSLAPAASARAQARLPQAAGLARCGS